MNISPKSIYQWYKNTLRNPSYRWWIILGTLAYLISPLDISPDIFPFVGQIDDVMIVTILLTEIFQIILEAAKPLQTKPSTEERGTTIDVEAMPLD
jgi:uncharacterized membrane protein YkvA (DUF1232 family)